LDAVEAVEEQVEAVEEKMQEPVKRRRPAAMPRPPSLERKPLAVGEKVVLRKLGTEGTVVSLDREQAEVQAGSLRMRVPLEQLLRKADAPTAEVPAAALKKRALEVDNPRSSLQLAASPGLEVDLRGLMAEDALDKLETYLDKAWLAGMPFVRIIHGKGTGKLRQVVREALKDHPHVRSFEEGGEKEGGEGVTVAKMASG
jgi:DNA mismatch repair protein MutS2